MALDLITSAMAAVNQQTAATAFLERTAAARQPRLKDGGFAAALSDVAAAAPQPASGSLLAPQTATAEKGAHAAAPERKKQAMLALEGTLMTKMADEMLPKDEHGLYGGGLAGSTWRSFEVENIGKSIAKTDLLHFNRDTSTARPTNLFAASGIAADPGIKITPFAG